MTMLLILGVGIALCRPGWGAGIVFSALTYLLFTELFFASASLQHYILMLTILFSIPLSVFVCGKLIEFYEPFRKNHTIISTVLFGFMWIILLNTNQIFDYMYLGGELINTQDFYTGMLLFTEILSKAIFTGCFLAFCLLLPIFLVETFLIWFKNVSKSHVEIPIEGLRPVVFLLLFSLCLNSIVGLLNAELNPLILIKLLN